MVIPVAIGKPLTVENSEETGGAVVRSVGEGLVFCAGGAQAWALKSRRLGQEKGAVDVTGAQATREEISVEARSRASELQQNCAVAP